MSQYKILFKMSGSIACIKACQVISAIKQKGHTISVACTPDVFRFVGHTTLESLSGLPVFHDIYEEGRSMDHIKLAHTADLVILCPATANTINQMACGIGSNAVTTLFLAHDFKRPYWIYPAMNTAMLNHPVTAAHITQLQSLGITIKKTGEGLLACGERGHGRLLEPDEILSDIDRLSITTHERNMQL